VETLRLKTVDVRFFIEVGTWRVQLAGWTKHPTAGWVTQPARPVRWGLLDGERSARLLIRDRDAKFPSSVDRVVHRAGVTIVRTPDRAPTPNAVAERWIRSVRAAGLNHLLGLNEAHPRRVLTADLADFNRARPHQGLNQRTPVAPERARGSGPIRQRDMLGGLLHDYYREAA
jgi:putative transposase